MAQQYDVVIRETTIVDGSGRPAFKGSIGVRGERIAAVGDVAGKGGREIDGAGLVTCPGFVDPHSHADLFILDRPYAENLVMQGITTFVGGNCGQSPAPLDDASQAGVSAQQLKVDINVDWRTFGEWLSKVETNGISPNYAPLVGHNTVRAAVMGADFKREATASEVESMKALVHDSMRSGAFGLSSFFDPGPGEYAAVEEIVELAKVVGAYGGLYVPHTRHIQSQWPSDDPEEFGYGIYHGPLQDVWVGRYRGYVEAIEISRQAQVPLHIAHLSTAYHIPQPHPAYLDEAAARATLEILDQAMGEGIDVTFDTIPCASGIAGPVPLISAVEGLGGHGKEGWVERLRTAAFREELQRVYDAGRLKLGMIHTKADPYWMDCFKIVRCKNRAYEGKTIGEIATSRGANSLEAIVDILVQDPEATWVQFLDRRMLPAAISVFLKHPVAMPCTDTTALLPAGAAQGGESSRYGAAPILFGLYPHYIETYVRGRDRDGGGEGDGEGLGLEEAIRKATWTPAQRFGLEGRGTLSPGAYADILLFDLENVGMKGDFVRPAQAPEGIECVMVNGQIVYEGLAHTGARPGKVIRRR